MHGSKDHYIFLCANAHHHLFSPLDTSDSTISRESRSGMLLDGVKEVSGIGAWNQVEKHRVVENEKQKLEDYFLAIIFHSLFFSFLGFSPSRANREHRMNISIQYLFVDWNHAFIVSDYSMFFFQAYNTNRRIHWESSNLTRHGQEKSNYPNDSKKICRWILMIRNKIKKYFNKEAFVNSMLCS